MWKWYGIHRASARFCHHVNLSFLFLLRISKLLGLGSPYRLDFGYALARVTSTYFPLYHFGARSQLGGSNKDSFYRYSHERRTSHSVGHATCTFKKSTSSLFLFPLTRTHTRLDPWFGTDFSYICATQAAATALASTKLVTQIW